MELSNYLIEQYYLGSTRLYKGSLDKNKKISEEIQVLQKMILADIENITISKDETYFVLKDGRKYIYEKSNSLDMFVLYNPQYGYDKVISKIAKPGLCILEVGACWGYYTILFSKLIGKSGKIYAYEPQEKAYELLLKNMKANRCNNIFPQKIALTNESGMATLFQAEDRLFFTSISNNFANDYKEEKCEMRKLDDCNNVEACDIIKVDIEGAECLFLDGAANYIAQFSPIIIIEIFKIGLKANGHCGSDVSKRLPGYQAFIEKNGYLTPAQCLDDYECEDIFFFKEKHIENYKNLFV